VKDSLAANVRYLSSSSNPENSHTTCFARIARRHTPWKRNQIPPSRQRSFEIKMAVLAISTSVFWNFDEIKIA
jgi:hypothetical protein